MVDWVDRLREHIERKGISQQTLASRLDMTYQGVNHWFCRRRTPPFDQFPRIADAAECSPAWMLFGVGPEEPITKEDMQLVRVIRQLPPEAKSAAEALLRTMAQRGATPPKTGTDG